MSEANSTTAAKPSKPAKPNPQFPLTAHPAGQWCKKIRGKIHYFGPWADPDGALERYNRDKDALHEGRKPRADTDAVTVKVICNAYLEHKQALVDVGELSSRTWIEYKAACAELLEQSGKTRLAADVDGEDFAAIRRRMAAKWGANRLAKMVQYVRSVFKHAYDSGLLDKPIRFGPEFKRPSKKTLRLQRAKGGAKLFTAEQIKALLDVASVQTRAMILLGVNAGLGNSDCGNLPLNALDLDGGMLDYPRPKTGVNRRASLWLETVDALREVIATRPEPKDTADADYVFITKYGQCWAKDTSASPLSAEFKKLLRKTKLKGRKGLGFYTLRHTFRTIADATKDQPAVDLTMGHESGHMSAFYRESISNERLKAVADHVHGWLFAVKADAATPDVLPMKKAK